MASFRRSPAWGGLTRRLLSNFGLVTSKGDAGRAISLSTFFPAHPPILLTGAAVASASASASLAVGASLQGNAAAVASALGSILTPISGSGAAAASASASLTTTQLIAAQAKAETTATLRSGVGLRRFGSTIVVDNFNTSFVVVETLRAGELLVVYAHLDQNPTITPVESGWTQLPVLGYGGSPTDKLTTWWRVIPSTGTYAFTFTVGSPVSTSLTNRVGVSIVAGADTIDPLEYVTKFESGATASTLQTIPAAPPTINAGDAVHAIYAMSNAASLATGPTPSVAAGQRNLFAISANGRAEAFFEPQPTAGAAPTWSMTTATSTQYLTQTLVIHAWGSALLAGSSSATATTAATLSVQAVAGNSAAVASASASLSVQTRFAASAQAVASTTAFLQPDGFTGTSAAAASASASLSTQTRFAGDAAATATAGLYTTPPADLAFVDNNFPTVYTHNSAGTLSVTVPVAQSNAALGDLILLTLITDATSVTPVESGWVQFGARQPLSGGTFTSRFGLYVFYCKDTRTTTPGSGTPINYTFTLARAEVGYSGIARAQWGIQRWRNAKFATPIYAYDEPLEAMLSNYPTPASVDGIAGDALAPSIGAQHAKDALVGMWAGASTSISGGTGPTGMTETRASGFTWLITGEMLNYEFSVGYKMLSAAGQTGDQLRTWTVGTFGGNRMAALSVVLRYQGAGALFKSAAAATVTATGTLVALQPIAGSASASASASLFAPATHALAGAASAASSVTADLTARKQFAASSTATASASASLTTQTGFVAAGQGRAAASADLTVRTLFAGAATAVAIARVREMLTLGSETGAAAAAAAATATLLTQIRLGAAAACQARAEATLGPFDPANPDLWVRTTPGASYARVLPAAASTAYDP